MNKSTFKQITRKGNFVAWTGDNDGEKAIAYMAEDGFFLYAINCMREGQIKDEPKDEDGVYPYHFGGDSVYPENEPRLATPEEVALYLKKMKEYGEDFISYEEKEQKDTEAKPDLNQSYILGRATIKCGGSIAIIAGFDDEKKEARIHIAEMTKNIGVGEEIPLNTPAYDPQVSIIISDIKSLEAFRDAFDLAEYAFKHGSKGLPKVEVNNA